MREIHLFKLSSFSWLKAILRFKQREIARTNQLMRSRAMLLKRAEFSQADWLNTLNQTERLNDRLGKAGIVRESSRKRCLIFLALLCLTFCLGTLAIFSSKISGVLSFLLIFGSGAYAGLLVASLVMRVLYQRNSRKILFHTPLVVESVILLVESGLGILPAIEKVIEREKSSDSENIVIHHLDLCYRLCLRGLPFSEAIVFVADRSDSPVLRHTLLHLDSSQTEGGELVPSLRNLARHSHSEWKLSAEAKVKRLENLVVFPVFLSVIGLMLLTAAVPLVPVIEFSTKLKQQNHSQTYNSQFEIGHTTTHFNHQR